MRFLLLWLVALPAFATDKPSTVKPPEATATATAQSASQANAAAGAASDATSESTSAGGQGGNGGSAGVDVRVENPLQAPGVGIASAAPSADCYYVNSWGVGVPGAGGGRARSRLDADCVVRKRAELLIAAGRSDLAVYLLTEREIPPEVLEPTPTVTALVDCSERATRALEACVSK